MKILKKLSINPEKVIKNEALVNLRGGYEEACTCTCFNAESFINNPDEPLECYGYVLSSNAGCPNDCQAVFGGWATGECGNNSLCF